MQRRIDPVRQRGLWFPGAGYAVAALGVAAMTGLLHLIPGASHVANVSMLYLLVVIGAALRFGSGPAILASVLAFLAFDWFFVQPKFQFTVDKPEEWLALVMFLITAVVTGQLTALLRARAEEAWRRGREATALAEASWAIASQVDRDRALAEVLRRLADVTGPDAAAILAAGTDSNLELAAAYPSARVLPDLSSGAPARAARFVLEEGRPVAWEGNPRHWEKALGGEEPLEAVYLPLTAEHRALGVLYLRLPAGHELSPQERRVVQSLASQAAVVLERDRLARAETASRALAEADRLKTALLSMVSHDFRSPLTSIKASVTGLLQKDAAWDPGTAQELLRGIDQETDRLNQMVGNILSLSRLEADAWRPQREATDVAELVGAALDSFSAGENRRIEVRLDAGLPEVSLDPVQMVQVLRNLVENALKYSAPEAPVVLRAAREQDTLVLEVLDRGPGLPAGDEARVFEPFYRAPHLQESAVPGVGIGLAVCRGLVEAHHGALTAGNRPGGGAVFRIRVPLEMDGDESAGR